MLGGGGFTGAVYEIGALRALDLLSVNRTVCDFDVYVGTSAGSLIAAFTANGITPEQMMRVVNDRRRGRSRRSTRTCCCGRTTASSRPRALKLPCHLAGVLRVLGPRPRAFSTVDLASRWPTRCRRASTPARAWRSTSATVLVRAMAARTTSG